MLITRCAHSRQSTERLRKDGRVHSPCHLTLGNNNEVDASILASWLTRQAIATPMQSRLTLWGKDLERAISASQMQPKIGDMIDAQRTGRDVVTVMERRRDAAGRIVSQQEHLAHRNQWRLEKLQFFAERAKLARRIRDAHSDVRETVRAYPELKSTFLTLQGR
jgi:hypothetical protein